MKTKFKTMLAVILAFSFVFALMACENHTHVYGTTYEKDAEGHWQICTVCNEPSAKANHVYGTMYEKDAEGHWQICTVCNEPSAKVAHVYDNDQDVDCNVCGEIRDVRTYKEKVLDFFEELDNPGDVVSLYGGEFNDIVAALKQAGAIAAEDNGVDMNVTAGYMKDGTTGTLSADPVAFADKAYDYNGLWLMYWADGSEYAENISMIAMSKSVLIGGGMYSLPVDAYIGNYAIAFKTVVDIKNVGWTADDGDWSEWKAGRDALASTELSKYQDKLDAFEALAAPTCLAEYTFDLLVQTLRDAKYISASEFIAPTDLNTQYSYTYGEDKTAYVTFAHKAVKYGKITIYFFDETDAWWSFTTYSQILKSLTENKTSKVWYDKDGTGLSFNFPQYYEDQVYQVDGADLTFDVDVVYGGFAIAVDD